MKIVFKAVDNACDTVFDQGHLEVDEQAKALVGEPEIGQKLFLVNRAEHLYGFDFHDDLVFDHQIIKQVERGIEIPKSPDDPPRACFIARFMWRPGEDDYWRYRTRDGRGAF